MIDPENNIQSYIEENHLNLLSFDNINSIQEMRAGFLKKTGNYRAKDFTFDYNEEQFYYFFITKSNNPNYLKPINRDSSIKPDYTQDALNNKGISFNFDYNKYLLSLVLVKKQQEKQLENYLAIPINRETCSVNHTTKEAIQYYRMTKTIKSGDAKFRYENFPTVLEKYYMIEIESKKPLCDTIIKEDGILSVLYLITPDKDQLTNLFTMVKYSVFLIKETLRNYINKYIFDMIYEMTHLPSDIFNDFLSHIGALSTNGFEQKCIFPLKKYMKSIQSLGYRSLIHHIYRNLPNIRRGKSADTVPFHKFIQMYEKYKQFYAEKEFRIKQKTASNNKNYSFIAPSLIKDPNNDKITKEHKINLKSLLMQLFLVLNEFLEQKLSNDKEVIRRFMIESLNKFLCQYTSFKGFFNLDIVMNEDSMLEFNCCKKNHRLNNRINTCAFNCVSMTLSCCNSIFEFNEGFFHKHFSILDYSYNFNEKNVIHTFPSAYDSSKKNKVRIFDIPFINRWNYIIASLILLVYRDSYGFLAENTNVLFNESYQEKSKAFFLSKFAECTEEISNEFFLMYEKVLPDYYTFCSRISKFPMDKYNCLDNLCQHFTNNSIQTLIRENIIFFSPFDIIYDIKQNEYFNKPNLSIVLEPYLILIDENLKNYLEKKEKKDKFLGDKGIDVKNYFQQLKTINVEKVHYNLFLDQEGYKEIEYVDRDKIPVYEQKYTNIKGNKPDKMLYDFYFLNNLSYSFIYKTIQEMKLRIINYDIVKRYIASIESSVTISFHDYDKTILQNSPRDIANIKRLKRTTKKGILKDLIIMNKIEGMTRRMCYMFSQYVTSTLETIIAQSRRESKHDRENVNSSTNTNFKNNEKYFIKIGHYLVNFLIYEKDNSIDSFMLSDYFKGMHL